MPVSRNRFVGPVALATVLSGLLTLPAAAQTSGLVLSKSFLGGTADPGGTVTLQFALTLDESAPGSATGITFTDDLGAFLPGLVATGLPATDVCGAGSQVSGTNLLSFSGGSLPQGGLCAFSILLTVPPGAAPGSYLNVTSDVAALVDGNPVQVGPAQAGLLVSSLSFSKAFTDDPVAAGGSVTLSFTISNNTPDLPVTDLSFSDDLDLVLPGLAATGLPASDVCGAGSQLSGTTTITLAGGSLAPGGVCTFAVTLDVPTGVAIGEYPNQTSALTGTLVESPVTIAGATDVLGIIEPLSFSKEFLDDPATPGGEVSLRFTISNADQSRPVTGLAFTDDLAPVLTGLVATGLPASGVCGAGSMLSGTTSLSFSGGTVAPADSCSFTVVLQVPAGGVGVALPNVTSTLTGTIDGAPTQAPPATDTLQLAPLSFAKEFLDDPALPGGEVSLRFTISNADQSRPVTGLAFTDDLAPVLAGLVATGLPAIDVCGGGSVLSGTTSLSFSGGTVAPGGTCSFTVVLQVPAGATGTTLTNVTSLLTGSIDGAEPTQAPPATDTLLLASTGFSKSFSGISEPGGTVELSFTIVNTDLASGRVDLSFDDDLDAFLPGLVVETLPAGEPCGTGSAVSGVSTISLAGGVLGPGESCTFLVTLRLPASVADGTYVNTTTPVLSAGQSAGAPAVASLVVRGRVESVPFTGGTGLLLLVLGVAAAGIGMIATRSLRPG